MEDWKAFGFKGNPVTNAQLGAVPVGVNDPTKSRPTTRIESLPALVIGAIPRMVAPKLTGADDTVSGGGTIGANLEPEDPPLLLSKSLSSFPC